MTKGKYIVFEGISGTGKETQAKLLVDYLSKNNIKANIVYHPSPELKEILFKWRHERSIDHLAEIYLLLADRESRVKQFILPALNRGEWVVSLRNYLSALVYQGKTFEERKWIIREFKKFELNPNYLFWFDLTPDRAMERIKKRLYETGEPLGKFETPQFLREKRKKYLTVLKKIPHIIIDASNSIVEIHKEIQRNINVLTR